MSPRLVELPEAQRPRERLRLSGADALSEIELLALVLAPGRHGLDSIEQASRLLAGAEDLASLSQASVSELATTGGLGPVRASRLAAAFALGRRIAAHRNLVGEPLRSAIDVDAWARPRLAALRQETFLALALDARHRVVRALQIAVGSLSGVEVHPREVFRPLVREAAAATVFVHNHPSGDPTPSRADVELTERLRDAGQLMGIPVLDHVVVAAEGYASLAEQGVL